MSTTRRYRGQVPRSDFSRLDALSLELEFDTAYYGRTLLKCFRQHLHTPFAVRRKAFRVAASWTQAELARKAKLAPARVKAYECGQAEPKGRNLVKLMNVQVTLGVGKNGPEPERDGQPPREQLPNKPM